CVMALAADPATIRTRAAIKIQTMAQKNRCAADPVSRSVPLCSIITTILLRLAMAPHLSPRGCAPSLLPAGVVRPHEPLSLSEPQPPTTREKAKQCQVVEG